QTHQLNQQKIEILRASTAKQDAQIRDTLRLLANTRKELVSASATALPEGVPSYDIRYDELLAYARRISKTTIPPVGALNAIESTLSSTSGAGSPPQLKGETTTIAITSAPETAATTPAGGTPTTTTTTTTTTTPAVNGTGTATAGATPQPHSQTNQISPLPANGQPHSQQTQSSHTLLPEPLAAFLNPHSAYTFVPWPSEEQIRTGSTAALAYLIEQGIEAENYDPELVAKQKQEEKEREEAVKEKQEEEDEKKRKAAEEREREAQQQSQRLEEKDRMDRERGGMKKEEEEGDPEAWRRDSVVGPSSAADVTGAGAGAGVGAPVPVGASPTTPAQPKAQFQFMGDDDDDDD
ncbi:vitamin-D-receptor interacting mediator subunit 4-domain-containing protein, partial [Xylariaceae sp. FL0594]